MSYNVDFAYCADYIRSKDARLANIATYPDSSILKFVNYGLGIVANLATPFTMSEQIDLSTYNGLTDFYITPSEEIINFYSTSIIDTTTSDPSVYVKDLFIEYTDDKRIRINTNGDTNISTLSLVMKYFYYPYMTMTNTIVMEFEVWHYLKHAMQIVVWGELKDYDKEQYHTKVLDTHLKQKTLVMPNDISMSGSMKGGFI